MIPWKNRMENTFASLHPIILVGIIRKPNKNLTFRKVASKDRCLALLVGSLCVKIGLDSSHEVSRNNFCACCQKLEHEKTDERKEQNEWNLRTCKRGRNIRKTKTPGTFSRSTKTTSATPQNIPSYVTQAFSNVLSGIKTVTSDE